MSTQSNLEATPLPEDSEVSASDGDTVHLQTDHGIVVSRESLCEGYDVHTVTGLAKPPDFDAIASRNSAALERLMKRLDGD
jgi:hypothetical protein